MFSRIFRVPSVQQSSTLITSLRTSVSSTHQRVSRQPTDANAAPAAPSCLVSGAQTPPPPAPPETIVAHPATPPASADAQAPAAVRKFHAATPAVRLIVTGCYAQRAPEELA